MYREIPSANRILSRKWNDYELQVHQRKLKEARAQITLQPPNRYRHFIVKSKKEQMQELERFTEIERANRILLEKMTIIMNKEKTLNPNRSISQHYVSNTTTLLPPPKRSLNEIVRKKENERIKLENRAFLRRLQDRTSTYNVNKWEEESKEREHLLHNLCQYKYILRDQNRRSFASNLRSRGLTHDYSMEIVRVQNFQRERPPQDRSAERGVSQSLDVQHILPPVDGLRPQIRTSKSFLKSTESKDPNQTVMTDLPNESVRPPPLLNESIDNPLQPRISTQGNDGGQPGNSFFSPKGVNSEFLPSAAPFGVTSSIDPGAIRPKGSVSPPQRHPQAFEFLKRKKGIGEKLKPLSLKSLQIFEGPSLKRVVLFREEYEIGHRNFLIEISRTKKKMMILALDVDLMTTSKQLLIQLTERQSKKLMDECQHDFQNVLKRLYLKYNQVLQIKEVNPPTHINPQPFHLERGEEVDEIDDSIKAAGALNKSQNFRVTGHQDMEMLEQAKRISRNSPQFPNVSHPSGETESVVALIRRSPSPISRALSPDEKDTVNYGDATPAPDDERPHIQEFPAEGEEKGERVISERDAMEEEEGKLGTEQSEAQKKSQDQKIGSDESNEEGN